MRHPGAAMSNGSDMVSSGAFSTAEFDEILGSDGSVDVERLCQASRLGCPPSLRGKVWKYLLGVSRPGRSDDAMSSKRLRNEFIRMQTEQARLPPLAPDILQRLRAEIRRRYAGMALTVGMGMGMEMEMVVLFTEFVWII